MERQLKQIKNLLEKRSARRKEGLFVAEGPHLIMEAGGLIKYVVYSKQLPIIEQLAARRVPCYQLSPQQFAKLSTVESPQGIMGVVKMTGETLTSLPLLADQLLLVYCFGLQDPGNLGTIIRSAEAFGADGVIVNKGTVDPYNQKTLRSSMGSIFHLPVVEVSDDLTTLKKLKDKNVKIVATAATGEDLARLDLTGKVALLVGNEGNGLPREIMALADSIGKLPMIGQAESLNAGVAASLALYESLRQRNHGR